MTFGSSSYGYNIYQNGLKWSSTIYYGGQTRTYLFTSEEEAQDKSPDYLEEMAELYEIEEDERDKKEWM